MSGFSVRMNEWQNLEPEEGSRLSGASLEGYPEARDTAEALTQTGCLKIRELRRGMEIRSTSFVGRIRLGPIDLSIHPKLPGLPLMVLLRYAYGLRNLSLLEDAQYARAEAAFQDVLIYQLIRESEELLSRGLHREYERMDEELSSPRGRLNMEALARRTRPGRVSLPCAHYPLTGANLLNRVLLAGLSYAASLTEDLILRVRLRRIVGVLLLYMSPALFSADTLRGAFRAVDRRTEAYLPSLRILELLRQGAGIDLEEEDRRIILSGMLFDMNRFFQALLSRFLHENLHDYTVRDEFGLQDLFSYDPERNPHGRSAPTPRPDFVIMKNGMVKALLDAKYRDLWENPLPRDMLYQLGLYSLSRSECPSAVILYPTLASEASEQRILLHEPLYGSVRAEITLRPVKLLKLAEIVQGEDGYGARKEGRAYAEWMVAG